MKASSRCKLKIKQLESFRGKAYRCSAGKWTIGYGFIKGVKEGDTMTPAEADVRFNQEIIAYEQAVLEMTGGNVNQNEFDALVSLGWNIGITGLRGSTVIKAHNRGDKAAASRAFGLWNKITVKGKRIASRGLTMRRAVEAAWYLEPTKDEIIEDMPQEVAPEKPLTSSTTLIAGGTAAVATVTQVTEQVSMFKYSVDGLGQWLVPVLLVVTLIAVGWIIYERVKSRKQGNV